MDKEVLEMKLFKNLFQRTHVPAAETARGELSKPAVPNSDVLNDPEHVSDSPCATASRTNGSALQSVYTLVPGGQPIELIDYYPEFASYYPECELQTKRWFVENIREDWVIFDIGANVGCYSVLFSRLAPRGRVFAFEPTETIEKLNRNLAFHGCVNVVAFERALGATDGTFEEDMYRWGQPPERMKYTFTTIDKMVRELELTRLDCLKIDIGSLDFEVLRGAEETLAEFDPWIVVELNHALSRRNQSTPEALQWLAAQGYTSALVLDHDNFVLRRADQVRGTGLPKFELTFDTRPLFLEVAHEKGGELSNLFSAAPTPHNEARIERDAGSWRVVAPGPRWSNAAEWPVAGEESVDAQKASFLTEIECQIEGGDVAFSYATADGSTILSETTVCAGSFKQTVALHKPEATPFTGLLLRNVDADGITTEARIFEIRCFNAVPAKPPLPASIMRPSTSSMSARDMARALGEKVELPASEDTIDIVPVESLGRALGFARPYISTPLYRHPLASFNTERDETPIFEFIYRNFQPRRHLEIGTWEGHGTVTVARVSEAEIWTVNLPEGERDADGNLLYPHPTVSDPSANQPSDAGAAIGWRYRAAGFGGRVHQILCNSLYLDVGQWSPGFFDSVFIDGGHAVEVVTSDTEKTLPLLRSGGLMIWHDFCPEPITLSQNEAPKGVVAAVATNLSRWRPQFAKMFWVRPSWILVGIKN
jgi:FkbM family methyltransferase